MERAPSAHGEENRESAPSPAPFVVSFEHARRSFKCVRVALPAESDASHAEQWVVTVAGRTIWSFAAGPSDTRASVRAEVEGWWDSTMSAMADGAVAGDQGVS